MLAPPWLVAGQVLAVHLNSGAVAVVGALATAGVLPVGAGAVLPFGAGLVLGFAILGSLCIWAVCVIAWPTLNLMAVCANVK